MIYSSIIHAAPPLLFLAQLHLKCSPDVSPRTDMSRHLSSSRHIKNIIIKTTVPWWNSSSFKKRFVCLTNVSWHYSLPDHALKLSLTNALRHGPSPGITYTHSAHHTSLLNFMPCPNMPSVQWKRRRHHMLLRRAHNTLFGHCLMIVQ